MAIGVGEEDKEVGSARQKFCFFAYLDILGFKNLVKRTTFEQLKGIVDDFTVGFAKAVDESRSIETNKGKIDARIKLGESIKVRIVSDSIYVWTENEDRLKQFEDLLHIVNAMLASGFVQGLPLRGVVTYGELFSGEVKMPEDIPFDFSFGNGSAVYGRAVVEAYELEGQMEWSGAILTPRAWAKVVGEFESSEGAGRIMRACSVKCANDLFNHFPYLLWYDVPFKNGKRKAIAFNWNYRPRLAVSMEDIYMAFVERGSIDDAAVALKHLETSRFFEYTKPFAGPCNKDLVRAMPTPDPFYAMSDLQNN